MEINLKYSNSCNNLVQHYNVINDTILKKSSPSDNTKFFKICQDCDIAKVNIINAR